ncbi:spore germination protein [Bacillus pseudomycoides]|uniref:Spore germination protein n=2 Tax=Bacillus pseudomycoides TaxID=64104 RepID=A0AAJ1Z3A3_9BACI|nr:spore germination protein [Bacillus pseudomycoides]
MERRLEMFKGKTNSSQRIEKINADSINSPCIPFGNSLNERLDWLRKQLDRCSDAVFHQFSVTQIKYCAVVYLKGMVNQELFQEHVLDPIMSMDFAVSEADFIFKILDTKHLSVLSYSIVTDLQEALNNILEGQIVLFLDCENRMIAFPFTKFEKRSVSEPKNEVLIRGPRESFVEDININVTMIRRRIKSSSLKIEEMKFGTYTQTTVLLAYIEGVCKQELVKEVKKRVSQIEIDGVLDSNYIEEFIQDNPLSPFPQLQTTERPDTLSASLLEGRIAILVDGSPIAVLAPVSFYMLVQSAEDYYQNFYAATWIRWIRYIFIVVSLLMPSFYIAVTTFHPGMIPTNLLLSMAAAREPVPFPALVEAFIMEITFEALREASIRIPTVVGQSVSILGALVIGQAAVQVGLVSAPMVIIVSITGIASFIIPNFNLGLTLRLLRFPIMIMAGTLGLFGLMICVILIFLHLVTLRSFGTPYLAPIAPLEVTDLKDVAVRAPWWLMRKRPVLFGTSGSERSKIPRRYQSKEEDDGD